MEQDNKQAQEIWETTTGGSTYIHVKDPRNPQGWVLKKVGGRGSKRITITVEEREFNQDLVPYEKAHHDPFTNGLLVRISPKDVTRGENEVTDEDLVAYLKEEEDDVFDLYLSSLTSEIVVRRLLELSKRHAPMYRHEQIVSLVDERYRIGKTQKVVEEIFADDAKYAGVDL